MMNIESSMAKISLSQALKTLIERNKIKVIMAKL